MSQMATQFAPEPVDDLSPALDLQMGATWRLAVVDFGVARVEPDDLALFLCFLGWTA